MSKALVYDAESAELKEVEFESSLAWMQKQVGGRIEIIFPSAILEDAEIDIFINEEGKLLGLPASAALVNTKLYDLIAGNILFVSHDDEGGTIPLSDSQIKTVREVMKDRRDFVVCGVRLPQLPSFIL